MGVNYTDFFDDAKAEAGRMDLVDVLPYGSNYFSCGYTPGNVDNSCYYNHTIAIAFAIIGKLYCEKRTGTSNYHQGVTYIAERAGVSKRQVKVLRKKYKFHGGYVFKTPYKIPEILTIMINLLDDKQIEPLVVEYLKDRRNDMYRDVLINKQFEAIEITARRNVDDKIKEVYNKLDCITKKIGG